MKSCTKCGVEKPLDDFVKDRRSPDGRTARCKSCTNADARKRHAERMKSPEARERLRQTRKAWSERNPGKNTERMREWRKNNPERARQASLRSIRALRERDPDYDRRWYRANIERERERSKLVMRRWRKENPEAQREARRRYRANNLEAIRAREREKTYARRAKQAASPVLAALMDELVAQPCAYCGSTENITIDHIIPLSRGGKHEASNLAPACLPCNCSKNNQLLSEWDGRLEAA